MKYPDNEATGGSANVIRETINDFEECHLQEVGIQLTVVGIMSRMKLKVGAVNCPPRRKLTQLSSDTWREIR